MCDPTAPSVPPVPDGLADRLRRVLAEAENVGSLGSALEQVYGEDEERAYRELLFRSDLQRLLAATVAAPLASPPATPTGEPEPHELRADLEHELRRFLREYEGSTDLDFLIRAECDRLLQWHREHAAPAPSGETAERAKALVTEAFERLRPYEITKRALADLAVTTIASAGLLSSPAQTPEPEVAFALVRHALHGNHDESDPMGLCPSCDEQARALMDALAASPAQTDGERE